MENKNTFDPQKQYKWENDDKITLTGSQFGGFVNVIQALAQTEIYQFSKAIDALGRVMSDVVKENVESGLFKEQTPDGVE